MRRVLVMGLMVSAAAVGAKDAAWEKFGADVPAGPAVPLAQALADPAAHEVQSRIFSGRVLVRATLSPAARAHTAEETSTTTPVPDVEYRILADGVQVLADDPGA